MPGSAGRSVSSFSSAPSRDSVVSRLEEGANPTDLLASAETALQGVFGVLFTVNKEKINTGYRWLIAKLALDFLQLFTVVFKPSDGWDINTDFWLWKLLRTLQFEDFLRPRGYSIFLAALYITVGLLALAVALSAWVAWCFQHQSFPWIWPIKVLRVYANVFFHVLDVATLTLLQLPFDCRWVGYPSDVQNTLIIFPSVVCTSMPHVIHMCVTGVALVVYLVMAALNLLADAELNPMSRNLWATANSAVEVRGFFIKFIMTVFTYATGWRTLTNVLQMLLSGYLTWNYLRWQPHLFGWVNHVRVGLYAGVTEIALGALVLVATKDPSPEFRERLTVVTLAVMGPAMLVGGLASYLRLNAWSRFVLLRYRTAPPGQKARRIYKFGTSKEVEIVSRVCRRWTDQHFEVPDWAAAKEAEIVIKGGMQMFPGDAFMALTYANFLIDVAESVQTGYGQLQVAKKCTPNLAIRFAIFTREQEQMQRSTGAKSGESSVDLVSYVEYQRNHRMVMRAHRSALIAIRNFWQLLLHNTVAFTSLAKALHRIERSVSVAEEFYRAALVRYPSSPKLMRGYGKFLETVKNNPWRAAKFLGEAEKLQDQQQQDEATMAVMGLQEGGGMGGGGAHILHRVDERVSIVFLINSAGIIQMANKNACSLLGYGKGELDGKNINSIMPPPFAQRHNRYIRQYIQTGRERVISSVNTVVALHKGRYVLPVKLSVSKVSGATEDSIFMGVLEPVPLDSCEAHLYLLPSGMVAAMDLAFSEWTGFELGDIMGKDVTALVTEAEAVKSVIPKFDTAALERQEQLFHGGTAIGGGGGGGGLAAASASGAPPTPSGAATPALGHSTSRSPFALGTLGLAMGLPGLGLSTAASTAGPTLGPAAAADNPAPVVEHLNGVCFLHKYTKPVECHVTFQRRGIGNECMIEMTLRRTSPAHLIALTGPSGRIRYIAAELAAALGTTPTALHRQPLGDIMPQPWATLHGGWVKSLSSYGPSAALAPDAVMRGSCRSGITTVLGSSLRMQGYYRLTISSTDEAGEVRHMLEAARSSREAALSERRMVLTVDADGVITEADDGPTWLYGFPPKSVVGRSLADIITLLRPAPPLPSTDSGRAPTDPGAQSSFPGQGFLPELFPSAFPAPGPTPGPGPGPGPGLGPGQALDEDEEEVSATELLGMLISKAMMHGGVSWRVGVTLPTDEAELAALGRMRDAVLEKRTTPAIMEIEVSLDTTALGASESDEEGAILSSGLSLGPGLSLGAGAGSAAAAVAAAAGLDGVLARRSSGLLVGSSSGTLTGAGGMRSSAAGVGGMTSRFAAEFGLAAAAAGGGGGGGGSGAGLAGERLALSHRFRSMGANSGSSGLAAAATAAATAAAARGSTPGEGPGGAAEVAPQRSLRVRVDPAALPAPGGAASPAALLAGEGSQTLRPGVAVSRVRRNSWLAMEGPDGGIVVISGAAAVEGSRGSVRTTGTGRMSLDNPYRRRSLDMPAPPHPAAAAAATATERPSTAVAAAAAAAPPPPVQPLQSLLPGEAPLEPVVAVPPVLAAAAAAAGSRPQTPLGGAAAAAAAGAAAVEVEVDTTKSAAEVWDATAAVLVAASAAGADVAAAAEPPTAEPPTSTPSPPASTSGSDSAASLPHVSSSRSLRGLPMPPPASPPPPLPRPASARSPSPAQDSLRLPPPPPPSASPPEEEGDTLVLPMERSEALVPMSPRSDDSDQALDPLVLVGPAGGSRGPSPGPGPGPVQARVPEPHNGPGPRPGFEQPGSGASAGPVAEAAEGDGSSSDPAAAAARAEPPPPPPLSPLPPGSRAQSAGSQGPQPPASPGGSRLKLLAARLVPESLQPAEGTPAAAAAAPALDPPQRHTPGPRLPDAAASSELLTALLSAKASSGAAAAAAPLTRLLSRSRHNTGDGAGAADAVFDAAAADPASPFAAAATAAAAAVPLSSGGAAAPLGDDGDGDSVELPPSVAEDARVVVIRVSLWRADILAPVLELDGNGTVVAAVGDDLAPPGLLLGLPSTALLHRKLHTLLDLPDKSVPALFHEPGTARRGGLKTTAKEASKVGILREVTAKHAADGSPVQLSLQAVVNDSRPNNTYVVLKAREPPRISRAALLASLRAQPAPAAAASAPGHAEGAAAGPGARGLGGVGVGAGGRAFDLGPFAPSPRGDAAVRDEAELGRISWSQVLEMEGVAGTDGAPERGPRRPNRSSIDVVSSSARPSYDTSAPTLPSPLPLSMTTMQPSPLPSPLPPSMPSTLPSPLPASMASSRPSPFPSPLPQSVASNLPSPLPPLTVSTVPSPLPTSMASTAHGQRDSDSADLELRLTLSNLGPDLAIGTIGEGGGGGGGAAGGGSPHYHHRRASGITLAPLSPLPTTPRPVGPAALPSKAHADTPFAAIQAEPEPGPRASATQYNSSEDKDGLQKQVTNMSGKSRESSRSVVSIESSTSSEPAAPVPGCRRRSLDMLGPGARRSTDGMARRRSTEGMAAQHGSFTPSRVARGRHSANGVGPGGPQSPPQARTSRFGALPSPAAGDKAGGGKAGAGSGGGGGGGGGGGEGVDNDDAASVASGMSGASGVSGVSEGMDAANPIADYRRGKRYKKLLKVLESPAVQRAARDFTWQAPLANMVQLLSNLLAFLLLTVLLHRQSADVRDLINATSTNRILHESFIFMQTLNNMYEGTYPASGFYAPGDMAKHDAGLKENIDDFGRLAVHIYQGVGNARPPASQPYNPDDAQHIWNKPFRNETVFYSSTAPFNSTRIEYRNASLWDLASSYIQYATEVQHMHATWGAEYGTLENWDAYRWVMANGLTEMFEGLSDALLQLTYHAIEQAEQLNHLQLILLILQGCVICTLLVLYMWWLQRRVSQQRYNLYAVFMTVPVGLLRALASKSVQVADNSEGEGSSGDEAEMAAADMRAAAAVAASGLDAGEEDRPESGGDGTRRGGRSSSGGGDGNGSSRPIRMTLANRGTAGHGSLRTRLSSLLPWKSAATPPSPSRRSGPRRRQLVPSNHDSIYLLAPFIVWGVLICLLYAIGYVRLKEAVGPLAQLSSQNIAVVRLHRLLFLGLKLSSEPTVDLRSELQPQLLDELQHFEREWGVLLYGANSTLQADRRFKLCTKKEALTYHDASLSYDMFRLNGCIATASGFLEKVEHCVSPATPRYASIMHGVSMMVDRFVEEVGYLTHVSPARLDINNTHIDWLWMEAQGNVEDGMDTAITSLLSAIDALYENVRLLQIFSLCVSWLLAIFFIFGQLRPFVQRNRLETQRIARMLSELPPEVDVESIVKGMLTRDPGLAGHGQGHGTGRDRRASMVAPTGGGGGGQQQLGSLRARGGGGAKGVGRGDVEVEGRGGGGGKVGAWTALSSKKGM